MHPLFLPLCHSLRNRFLPGGRPSLRTLGLALFGLALTVGLYLVSLKVVGYFHRQSELGVFLSLRIFQMAWVIIFAMLIFSAMVSGVSTVFLSRDNEIFQAGPVPAGELYLMRYLTTWLYTSWMMVVFSLPVFGAFGAVFQAGPLFPPLLLLAVLATAAIASGIGLSTIIVLVTLFPAKRTKDIVVYLSLLFSILLFLAFRLLRPEELADPDKFPDFMEYLSALQTPATPLLPPSWAANLLTAYLREQQVDWLLAALLLLTPLVLFFLGQWLMQRFFFAGFSKAQESFGGHRNFAPPPASGSALGWMLRKELKTFGRDSAEWSQLFLIGALVVMYLYNFKVLPLDRAPMATEHLGNLIAYANIGLTGFLIASLSARFVYPSIGAEGEGFGLIRCAPISLHRYLAYKYCFYLIPFSLLALVLLIASNHLLGIKGPMLWISVLTGLIITAGVVAMALGFGAWHADFTIENRAAVQGSFGTILFLFSALALTLVIIGLAGFPAYRFARSWLGRTPLSALDLALSLAMLLAIIAGTAAISAWCLRRGLRKLAQSA